MGVLRVVGQRRGDHDFLLAVLHARHVLDVGCAAVTDAALGLRGARPHAVVGGHAVAVGHALLHFADVLVAQLEIGRHHFGQVQQVGKDRVDLVRIERLGRRPRHRALDVIEQRRHRRHLHQRRALREGACDQRLDPTGLDVLQRGATDERREHLVGLAERAVATGAVGFPQRDAVVDIAAPLGQAGEVRAHVDVPRLHFGRRGLATDAGIALPGRGRGRGARQEQRNQRLREPGHCSPPRIRPPSRTGWRCCDRWTWCRALRAIGHSSAARSRFRRPHATAGSPACRPTPSRC